MSIIDRTALVQVLAGAFGGSIGVIVTSPLEVIKTRLQSTVSTYQQIQAESVVRTSRGLIRPPDNLIALCRSIVKHEGVSSLWKGLGPSLVAVIPTKSLFFLTNSYARGSISRNLTSHTYTVNFTAGTVAGMVNAFTMNPFWVVKTKLQLDEQICNRMNSLRCLGQIYKTEGIRGFFRGASASLAGSYEQGIYFVIYEELKERKDIYMLFSDTLRETSYIPITAQLMLSSCSSKILSNTIVYPTEVIRTRLRQEDATGKRKYRTFWQTFRTIQKEEGIQGLYSGWKLQFLKTIPFTIITFLVYEAVVTEFSPQSSKTYKY